MRRSKSVIRLSPKGANTVLALIENPPKPNQRLKDAVKAFKARVRCEDAAPRRSGER